MKKPIAIIAVCIAVFVVLGSCFSEPAENDSVPSSNEEVVTIQTDESEITEKTKEITTTEKNKRSNYDQENRTNNERKNQLNNDIENRINNHD